MRILLIEDNEDLADSMKAQLKKHFTTDIALTGTDGTYLSQINKYDLIIIDIGLPDIDGVEVCRMIRASGVEVPILMLTGKTDIVHKVSSLDSGADDYLTKPFDVAELTARLRALLRRNPKPEKSVIIAGIFSYNPATKAAKKGNKTLKLRRKELELFECFMRNPGILLTKEALLESIWEKGLDVASNTLEAHISSLRNIIGKDVIATIYGVGYKFEAGCK